MLQKRTVISILLAVVLIFSAIYFVAVRRARDRAAEFLAIYRSFALGETTYDEARRRLSSFEGNMHPYHPCISEDECSLHFQFTNSFLQRVNLAPPTALISSLHFRQRVLRAREVTFGQGICCVVVIREGPTSIWGEPLTKGSDVHIDRNNSGVLVRAIINLAPNATQQETDQAYSLNISCLSRVGGCNSAAELISSLPSVHSER